MKNFIASAFIALGLWFAINAALTSAHAQTMGGQVCAGPYGTNSPGGGCNPMAVAGGCGPGCTITSYVANRCDGRYFWDQCVQTQSNVNATRNSYACLYADQHGVCNGCDYSNATGTVTVSQTINTCN